MSRRNFSILAAAALVAAIALLLVPGRTGRDVVAESSAFLPGLDAWVNQVDRVVFTGAGDSVATLTRDESGWRVSELYDYPADWDRLREVLAELARAKVIEAKTSNPEYYDRLGVEDVEDADAQGTMVELFDGEAAAALIAGKDALDRGGQYMRQVGEAGSVLIDRSVEVSADPVDWVAADIIDIGSALVAEVEITHPDGDRIIMKKVSADDADFTLENLPQGREPASSWSVNSLANALTVLRLDHVRPDEQVQATEPVTLRLVTFDGLQVEVESFVFDDENWLRVKPVTLLQADETLAVDEQTQQLADEINARTSGWIYQVNSAKFQQMTKRLEDILKPVEDDS